MKATLTASRVVKKLTKMYRLFLSYIILCLGNVLLLGKDGLRLNVIKAAQKHRGTKEGGQTLRGVLQSRVRTEAERQGRPDVDRLIVI